MSTTTSVSQGGGAVGLDARLHDLIEQIEQPGNQGEGLRPRDYIALLIVTIGLPVLLTIWGVLAS